MKKDPAEHAFNVELAKDFSKQLTRLGHGETIFTLSNVAQWCIDNINRNDSDAFRNTELEEFADIFNDVVFKLDFNNPNLSPLADLDAFDLFFAYKTAKPNLNDRLDNIKSVCEYMSHFLICLSSKDVTIDQLWNFLVRETYKAFNGTTLEKPMKDLNTAINNVLFLPTHPLAPNDAFDAYAKLVSPTLQKSLEMTFGAK